MCLFPTSGTSSFKFCSFTLNASRCADKACLLFQRRLWKSIWGKLSPFSWKESPGVSHKPECIQGSSPTREEVVENVYVPVAVTFLASDLFRIWQTGPECGVSAADLCVKRSWKLVNNGYEVEVPTPDLYHMQQLAMLMRKVFPARGFLRCQVIVRCTSTVIIFGKEQKQLHRIIFPTVASHSSLEGKQTGQETPFWTCKEDRELIFISVNMSSLHIPVLFI